VRTRELTRESGPSRELLAPDSTGSEPPGRSSESVLRPRRTGFTFQRYTPTGTPKLRFSPSQTSCGGKEVQYPHWGTAATFNKAQKKGKGPKQDQGRIV